MAKINNDWDELLKDEFKKDYYLKLRSFLIDEYNKTAPSYKKVYSLVVRDTEFDKTPSKKIKRY